MGPALAGKCWVSAATPQDAAGECGKPPAGLDGGQDWDFISSMSSPKDAPGSAQPVPAAPSTADALKKPLPPAAERALAEAAARRAERDRAAAARPKELQGPGGLDPTRYGDWERKGIASDF